MRSLGLAIKKNEIWYSVVEGDSMDDSYIVETGKQNFRAEAQGRFKIFAVGIYRARNLYVNDGFVI